MTTEEFNNEFDILYDSITSHGAPDLDMYEKSVFLTKAQLELVKEVNGGMNKYGASFEGSDKRRADMRELIKDYTVVPTPKEGGLSAQSYTAVLPNDCFLIKYEAASYVKAGCDEPQVLDITPIKYDEYHNQKRNPFRKPDYQNGFRLDIASVGGVKIVELIAARVLTNYHIRYIQYPTPIVLTDLDWISSNETLSVDGVAIKTECALDQEFHREILDRAVELAMLAYRGEALPAKVQLDQRNN
jgi:hypothetical protein